MQSDKSGKEKEQTAEQRLAATAAFLKSTSVVNPSKAGEKKDTFKLATGRQDEQQTSSTTLPTSMFDAQGVGGSSLPVTVKTDGKGKGSVTFETGNARVEDLGGFTAPVLNIRRSGGGTGNMQRVVNVAELAQHSMDTLQNVLQQTQGQKSTGRGVPLKTVLEGFSRRMQQLQALQEQGGSNVQIEEVLDDATAEQQLQQQQAELLQQQRYVNVYGSQLLGQLPSKLGDGTLHGTKEDQVEEDAIYDSIDVSVSPVAILQQNLNGILTRCQKEANYDSLAFEANDQYQAVLKALSSLSTAGEQDLPGIVASINDNETIFPTIFPTYEVMTTPVGNLGASETFVAPPLPIGRPKMPVPTQDNSRLIAFLKQDYDKVENYLQGQLAADTRPSLDSGNGDQQALLQSTTQTGEYKAFQANLEQLQLLKLAESEDQINQDSLSALIGFLTLLDTDNPLLGLGIKDGDAKKATLYQQCLVNQALGKTVERKLSDSSSTASEHGAGDPVIKEAKTGESNHHIVNIPQDEKNNPKHLITLLDPKKQQSDWYVLGGLAALFTVYNSMRLVPSLREDEGSAKTDGMIVEIFTAVMFLAIFAYHTFRFRTVYPENVAKMENRNRETEVSGFKDTLMQHLVEYRQWPLKSLPANGYLSQLRSYITKNPTQQGLNHVIEMIDKVVEDIKEQDIPWRGTLRSLDGSEISQDVKASNQTVVQLLHLRDILNKTLIRQKRFHQGERNVIGLVLQAIIGALGFSFSVYNAAHMRDTGITNTFVALNSLGVLQSLLVFYSLRPSAMTNKDLYNLLQRENYLAEARIEMSNTASDISFNTALNLDGQAFAQASDKIIDDLAVAALEIYRNHRDHLRDLLSNGRVRSGEASTADMQREFIQLIDRWFQTQIEVLIGRASRFEDADVITQKRDYLLTRLNQLRKSLVVMVSLDLLADQDLEDSLSTNAALTNAITALLSKLGSVSYNNLTDNDALDGSVESKTLIYQRRIFVESYINLMVSDNIATFQTLFNKLNDGGDLVFQPTMLAPFAIYNRDVIRDTEFNFSGFDYENYRQYAMYFHANDGCNDGKFADNQDEFMTKASRYLVDVLGFDAGSFESPRDILVALVTNAPDDYANLAMQSIINADNPDAAFLVAVKEGPEAAGCCGKKVAAACITLGGLFSKCFKPSNTDGENNVVTSPNNV